MYLLIVKMSCMLRTPLARFYNIYSNARLVFVHDPTDNGDSVIPIGKQTLHPSHIFYTPCSGIWQSVWVESAPANHITQLEIDANMHGKGKRQHLGLPQMLTGL